MAVLKRLRTPGQGPLVSRLDSAETESSRPGRWPRGDPGRRARWCPQAHYEPKEAPGWAAHAAALGAEFCPWRFWKRLTCTLVDAAVLASANLSDSTRCHWLPINFKPSV